VGTFDARIMGQTGNEPPGGYVLTGDSEASCQGSAVHWNFTRRSLWTSLAILSDPAVESRASKKRYAACFTYDETASRAFDRGSQF
jgi:hypothetical protein